MASTEKIFTLSYDELLEHTKKSGHRFQASQHAAGHPGYLEQQWSHRALAFTLVEAMGVPGKDYLSDLRQLKSLGGLNFCDQGLNSRHRLLTSSPP